MQTRTLSKQVNIYKSISLFLLSVQAAAELAIAPPQMLSLVETCDDALPKVVVTNNVPHSVSVCVFRASQQLKKKNN